MTTIIESMRMAVEALEDCLLVPNSHTDLYRKQNVITALQSAIKQMEQCEPVAWMITTNNTNLHKLDPNRESNWLSFDAVEFRHNTARSLEIVEETPLFFHPAPTIPAGFALVPIKPTLEMIESVSLFDQHSCVHTYRAMLAAAPKPEDK